MDVQPPRETEGREDYYDAALICIVLFCDKCSATLDPDTDLGPDVSSYTDSYYILLGDEAYRRGWLIETTGDNIKALCPTCAKNQTRPGTSAPS